MDFWVDGCHGVKMVDGGEWFGTRFFFFLIIFLGGRDVCSSFPVGRWIVGNRWKKHITKDSYC